MKILHIEDRFHPEMGYQINFFAKYHNPADEFIVIASDSFSLWQVSDKHKIYNIADKEFEKKYNVRIVRLPIRSEKGAKYNIWLNGLIDKICDINPDVIFVHAIEMRSACRVILSPRLKKYKIVADTHTLYNQFRPTLKYKIFLWLFRNLIISRINKRNIKVFYTAEENGQILRDIYGVKNSNIIKGLIGTDIQVNRFSETERENIRQQLEVTKDDLLLLYTGKLNHFKQPHLILQALKIIENNINHQLHVVFIGPVDKKYYDENFTDTFGQNIRIHILGTVKNNELFKYYSAADFGVFPKENTLSALDAQACKLPLIMERDQTNIERLKEGGLVYEPNNIYDLAAKIFNLIESKSLRAKLAENGYRYMIDNYDYRKIINEIEKTIVG